MLPIIPRAESLSSTPWVGVTVLLALLALLTVLSLNRQQYALQLRNVVNSRERVMAYDAEQRSVAGNVLLWVLVVMSYALAGYSFLFYLSEGARAVSMLYGLMVLVSGVGLGLKWCMFRFFGLVFGIRDRVSNFSGSYFICVATFGIVSLVMAATVIYAVGVDVGVLLGVYGVLGVLMLVFVLFKAIQIFYCGIGSLFYIFLYLCTLEIMPAMLVLKAASMV